MNAQEVIPNKFWIVTDKYGKVGTLRACSSGFEFFDNRTNSKTVIDSIESFSMDSVSSLVELEDCHVEGFPTKETPFPASHHSLPVYRKTINGKAIYAAGYYIIKFDGMGWQWAFSPKLATLEKYNYKGPFRSEWEMNLELNRHKKQRD